MKFNKMLTISGQQQLNVALLAYTVTTLFGFISAQAVGAKDLFRCRQSCYQKFVQDWHHCMDFEDCKNMCITPPNINNYIPEAFSFLCWNNCDQQLGPFPLNINSALRQGSLVLTDIGWDQAITNASKQCLVTWEVSGGGLMGNLLTDSSTVELSLWPDTIYHVQVTCKHKETGGMRRSYKLIVDTHKLSDSTATGLQAIAIETNLGKTMPNIYTAGEQIGNSGESDSRMRILKDSSKDFLSPYNPNANIASAKDTRTKTGSISTSTTTTKNEEGSATHINSVLRTKLKGGALSTSITSSLFVQPIAFAVIASVIIFLGVLLICLLTRPVRKEVPVGAAGAIDHEVLIHNELLPSQTPAALKSTGAGHSSPVTSAISTATATVDTRTLHV